MFYAFMVTNYLFLYSQLYTGTAGGTHLTIEDIPITSNIFYAGINSTI